MASRKIPSPESPQQAKPSLIAKYNLVLRKAERQTALAKEMGKNAKKMSDDAVKMRDWPLYLLLP